MVDAVEIGDLALGDDDAVVALLLVYRMMTADVAVNRSARGRADKLAALEESTDQLATELWACPDTAPVWRRDLADDLTSAETRGRRDAVLDRAARKAATHVPTRERQLLVLIDLIIAEPWPSGLSWVEKARDRTLDRIVAEFDAVESADRRRIEECRADVIRRLRREKPMTVKRKAQVAAVGAVGVGIGVATMGMAAPAVGAALGGAVLGLSGAAATSAGLAMLGGGALAAGGFGMAGGTAVLVGVGGVAGAGFAVGGARLASVRWNELALDAIRVQLRTVIVTLGEQRDDDQARRVALLLRRRLDEVTVRLIDIATRLQEERASNGDLRAELEEERERAVTAENALRWALDRLAEAGVDTGAEVLDTDPGAEANDEPESDGDDR